MAAGYQYCFLQWELSWVCTPITQPGAANAWSQQQRKSRMAHNTIDHNPPAFACTCAAVWRPRMFRQTGLTWKRAEYAVCEIDVRWRFNQVGHRLHVLPCSDFFLGKEMENVSLLKQQWASATSSFGFPRHLCGVTWREQRCRKEGWNR